MELCDPPPPTDAFKDLLVTHDMTGKHAAYVGLKHGAAVVPSMLTKETANELRYLILAINFMHTGVADIATRENRYRVQPSYNIPIVKEL
jgi:hypothetical protein